MKNCNTNILNFCQLVDEDWKDKVINFYSDISEDDFILEIEIGFLKNKKVLTLGDGLTKVQNTLVINDPELRLGRFPYKLIRIHEDDKRVILSGHFNVVEVHDDDCNCGCGCEIYYDVFEGIVNITGATIEVGETVTVDPDQPADVENIGTDENVILKFEIPRGQRGLTGLGLEFDWQDTQLGVRIEGEQDYQYVDLKGDKGDNLEFTWRGTELGVRVEGEEDYQYGDLKGEGATITVGNVTTLDPGDSATVNNSGTPQDAVFNFEIPRGEKGDTGNAATIEVGSTVTVEPDQPANVSNSGDENDAVFNFEIPKGDKGEQGNPFTYNDFTPQQILELQQPAIEAKEDVEEALNGKLTYNDVGQVNTINIDVDTPTVTKYELTDDTNISITQPNAGEAYTKVLIISGDYTLTMPVNANPLSSSEDYNNEGLNQIVLLVSEDFINYSINSL